MLIWQNSMKSFIAFASHKAYLSIFPASGIARLHWKIPACCRSHNTNSCLNPVAECVRTLLETDVMSQCKVCRPQSARAIN